MKNLFRLFLPLIINPYYYLKKIEKKTVKNFFEYENKPYDRTSFIMASICHKLAKKNIFDINYLEIGVFDNKVFNTIPLLLDKKIGVDPKRGGTHRMTSDVFFSNNKTKFDIIFIDGLHTYEQCQKDCINSIKYLKDGGVIFFHDMLPRSSKEEKRENSGDVWKVAVELVNSKNLKFVIANIDHGIGILYPSSNTLYKKQKHLLSKNFQNYKNEYYKTLPIVNLNTAFDFIRSN